MLRQSRDSVKSDDRDGVCNVTEDQVVSELKCKRSGAAKIRVLGNSEKGFGLAAVLPIPYSHSLSQISVKINSKRVRQ
jgi:hypothetical protein